MKFCLPALTLVFLVSTNLAAQSSSSERVHGFFSITIPAAQSVGSRQLSVVSLPLYQAPLKVEDGGPAGEMTGRVTAITNETLTAAEANWEADALSQDNAPYYVRFTSGSFAGLLIRITANSETTLTLDNRGEDLITYVSPGQDTFEIIAGHTLLSAFGTGEANLDATGVVGSTNNAGNDADQIQIHDSTGWNTYIYNTLNQQWQLKDSLRPSKKDDTIIRPDAAIIYNRAGTSDLQLVTTGYVPDQDVQVLTLNGVNMVAANFPIDRELQDLKLEEMPSWRPVGGPDNYSAEQADAVTITDGTSGWKTYVYHAQREQWELKDSLRPSDQGDTPILAGNGIMILKQGDANEVQVFADPLPENYQLTLN